MKTGCRRGRGLISNSNDGRRGKFQPERRLRPADIHRQRADNASPVAGTGAALSVRRLGPGKVNPLSFSSKPTIRALASGPSITIQDAVLMDLAAGLFGKRCFFEKGLVMFILNPVSPDLN